MNGIPKDCKALGKIIEDWFFFNGMTGEESLFDPGDGEQLIKHLVEYGVVMVPVEPTEEMQERAKKAINHYWPVKHTKNAMALFALRTAIAASPYREPER